MVSTLRASRRELESTAVQAQPTPPSIPLSQLTPSFCMTGFHTGRHPPTKRHHILGREGCFWMGSGQLWDNSESHAGKKSPIVQKGILRERALV